MKFAWYLVARKTRTRMFARCMCSYVYFALFTSRKTHEAVNTCLGYCWCLLRETRGRVRAYPQQEWPYLPVFVSLVAFTAESAEKTPCTGKSSVESSAKPDTSETLDFRSFLYAQAKSRVTAKILLFFPIPEGQRQSSSRSLA